MRSFLNNCVQKQLNLKKISVENVKVMKFVCAPHFIMIDSLLAWAKSLVVTTENYEQRFSSVKLAAGMAQC